MAHYFVGDIQGCFNELQALLAKVEFNPSKDELWAVGDLVARGPDSLATLRFFKALEGSGKVVLGNHDLHLMSLHHGIKKVNPKDKLQALLQAEDINQLIDWLRLQPLHRERKKHKIIMSHAGIPPQWDLDTLRKESKNVSKALQKQDYATEILAKMYTDEAEEWHDDLSKFERVRYTINALTRMRYLHTNGKLDFQCKLPPRKNTDPNLHPWFTFDSKISNKYTKVFGHWAALMGRVELDHIQALDTGCCWGEHLTLWHQEKDEKIPQKPLEKD